MLAPLYMVAYTTRVDKPYRLALKYERVREVDFNISYFLTV